MFFLFFTDFSTEDRIFHCPNKCGRKYKYRGGLQAHLRLECGIEPKLKCDLCCKKFRHRSSLKSHYLRHGRILD